MFNLSQPYSGSFYNARYLEYDEVNKKYKVPKNIRLKQKSDGSQGIATGGKDRIRVQESGRWVEKSTWLVEVIENNPYKIRDKIEVIVENKTYTIWKVGDGFDSINAMANLMFTNLKTNKPFVLYLGE